MTTWPEDAAAATACTRSVRFRPATRRIGPAAAGGPDRARPRVRPPVQRPPPGPLHRARDGRAPRASAGGDSVTPRELPDHLTWPPRRAPGRSAPGEPLAFPSSDGRFWGQAGYPACWVTVAGDHREGRPG